MEGDLWRHAGRPPGAFPEELQGCLARYARKPLYSTDSGAPLALALRGFDTLDQQRTVAEIPLHSVISFYTEYDSQGHAATAAQE